MIFSQRRGDKSCLMGVIFQAYVHPIQEVNDEANDRVLCTIGINGM